MLLVGFSTLVPLTLCGSLTLSAQSVTPQDTRVRPGVIVRVWTSRSTTTKREASVLAVRGDTIVLEARRPREQFAVPLGDVRGLELQVKRGSHTGAGVLLGLLAGAVGGAIIGHASYQGPRADGFGAWIGSVQGGAEGGALGAIVGGVMGHQMSGRGWEPVLLPLQASMVPRTGGSQRLVLSLSIPK